MVREEAGNKVLVKTTEGSSLLSRARAYMGPSDFANYTVEADVLATQKRRQQGDAGVIAQRYVLTLLRQHSNLHLEPWQPETERTEVDPFCVEARHLVSIEVASRESSRRKHTRARKSLAGK